MHPSLYNPTSDAVWLAAFVACAPRKVLDVGTGTGAVALCLMARLGEIDMTVLDISSEMLDAAKQNFELNDKTANFINADILSWRTNQTFDLVITNPPYFKGTPATHNAHHNSNLELWTRKCIARVRPKGVFITIVDATETGTIISEMTKHCGNIQVLPLFSKKHSAERVLLSCQVGRAPTTTIIHELPMNCDKILRQGLGIGEILPLKS